MKSFYKKNLWFRFLVHAAFLYALFLFFYQVLRDIEFINNLYVSGLNYFAIFLLDGAEFLLGIAGYETVTFGKTIEILDNFTNSGIYLDRGCMGRNIMLSYTGLILIAPGKLKHKLWFIPAGIAVIVLINIARVAGMAFILYESPQYADINHYVVFRAVAWIAILLMWAVWFKKFSGLKPKIKS